ncbi:hypothetical protein WJX79_005974 [Trebouxia sp. C0005]
MVTVSLFDESTVGGIMTGMISGLPGGSIAHEGCEYSLVPVQVVFLNHPDERFSQCLVGALSESICLRVVGAGELMINATYVQQSLEFSLELASLICDHLSWVNCLRWSLSNGWRLRRGPRSLGNGYSSGYRRPKSNRATPHLAGSCNVNS